MNVPLENKVKAVIHQPYFLPWMGYFAKLMYADKFIVLDNVFFSKRKFIDRVQIINTQGEQTWIGLKIGEHYNQYCNEIRFTNSQDISLILKNIKNSYSKARHFKENISKIEEILLTCNVKSDILSNININIVLGLMKLLNMKIPEIIFSSNFETVSNPSERIIMLCEKTRSDSLIVGSIEGTEIHDVSKLMTNGIDILLQDYYNNHPTYYQTRRTKSGFAKGLSIIDCILNIGIEDTNHLLLQEPIPYYR